MNLPWLLSALIALPLVFGTVLALLPGLKAEPVRLLAIAVQILLFLLSLPLLLALPSSGYGFEETREWVPGLNIRYHLGVDGISGPLVVLTTLLAPIVLLSSYGHVKDRVRQYCVLLLWMEAGMVGAFCALDLVLFYLFFEMSLIPLYLVVGVYGGARRIHAAFKFVAFTVAGSLFLLIAILYLLQKAGTSDYPALLGLDLSAREELYLFAGFALAFGVKVPLFPAHTWLPDAHVEAPTGGSVILAGITLKMGAYGLLRFALPLFPRAAHQAQNLFLVLAVIGILYGALLAWAQTDLKKLIAYSSISHLGFVVLGIFAVSTKAAGGSVLTMVGHGLSTGALFLLVGMIYERARKRGLEDFGGLARTMPWFTVFLILATLSSIGLPGLNGFVGEFLILLGTFEEHPFMASLGAIGVLLGAIYMLGMVKSVLFGPIKTNQTATYADLSAREIGLLAPLFVLMLWIGLFPGFLLDRIGPAVDRALQMPRLEQSAVPSPGLPCETMDRGER